MFDVQGLNDGARNLARCRDPSRAIVATILGTLLGLALGPLPLPRPGRHELRDLPRDRGPRDRARRRRCCRCSCRRTTPARDSSRSCSRTSGSASPFVAVTVRARVAGSRSVAGGRGAGPVRDPVTAFFKVTLPLIMPGIVAGFLLAFVLSLDDFVITNFVRRHDQDVPDLGVRRHADRGPAAGERDGARSCSWPGLLTAGRTCCSLASRPRVVARAVRRRPDEGAASAATS